MRLTSRCLIRALAAGHYILGRCPAEKIAAEPIGSGRRRAGRGAARSHGLPAALQRDQSGLTGALLIGEALLKNAELDINAGDLSFPSCGKEGRREGRTMMESMQLIVSYSFSEETLFILGSAKMGLNLCGCEDGASCVSGVKNRPSLRSTRKA